MVFRDIWEKVQNAHLFHISYLSLEIVTVIFSQCAEAEETR